MAANPPLVQSGGALYPAPYNGEYIALSRDGVEIKLENVRTQSGKWCVDGTLFLTNMRLVFVAPKPDKSGLQAFELPLAYILHGEKFSQPILGCNNLSGHCQLVDAAQGGQQQTVRFTLYFKQGGINTCIPLFFQFLGYIRVAVRNQQAAAQQQAMPSQNGATAPPPPPAAAPHAFLQTALVDPSDPSKIYLTQPVDDSQRRPDAPKFGGPLI